jgi:hypothetical protein
LFIETTVEFAVLACEFGDGFEAAAMVGTPEGTRTWAARVDVLPGDSQGGAISSDIEPSFVLTEEGDYVLTEDGDRILLEWSTSRAAYLFRFFRASEAAGNPPFQVELEDPADGTRKLFLCSFAEKTMTYQIFCAKVFSQPGIKLRQRRLSGVESPVDIT